MSTDKVEATKQEKPLLLPASETQAGQDFDLELGEYLLHVYVERTQGLLISGERKGILCLEAFGEKVYSKVKTGLIPGARKFWGEHFFLNRNFTTREELENAAFIIRVFDHNAVFKDSLIGQTALSCLRVYGAEDHAVQDRWSILTNSKRKLCTPMGFVKYSVNFVRAGEKRVNLESDYDSGRGAKLKDLDLPPELTVKKRQIVVHLYRGGRIVKMDTMGEGADPYVKFDFGGLKIESDYKKGQLNPVFAQNLLIPTIYPTIVDKLHMKFKDYDSVGSNEYIGSKSFDIRDIERGVYAEPSWQYFYGAHAEAKDKEMKDQMNKIPEIASRFKGACMLAIELKTTETAAFCKESMNAEDMDLSNEMVVDMPFTASLFVDYIQNFKSKAKPHKISLDWGGKQVWSQQIDYNQGVMMIMQEIQISETFGIPKSLMDAHEHAPSKKTAERILHCVPDIILSVVLKDKHLTFYRLKPYRYLIGRDHESQPQEIKLHADQAVSDLREDLAGLIRLKISCGMSRLFQRRKPDWVGVQKQARYTPMWIELNLFQAKGLMSSDSDGTSDPVVQLYHFGGTSQSAIFPKTLNPVWNQRLFMKTYMVNDSIPSAILNVWDKDENWAGSRSFEFLGYSLVTISHDMVQTSNFHQTPRPKWYELCLGKGNRTGKVLASIRAIPKAGFNNYAAFQTGTPQYWRIPIPKKRHHIKISILGLRGLESVGILPIKTAGIKIATSSLQAVENMRNGAVFTDLVAMAKTSGSDPTIGTVLSLSADIPADVKIMPIISCAVQEMGFRLFGNRNTIGSFSIDLGRFAVVTKQNLVKKLCNMRERFQDNQDRKEEIDNLIDEIQSSVNVYSKEIISEGGKLAREAVGPIEKRQELDAFALQTGIVEDEYNDEDEEEMLEMKRAGPGGMGGMNLLGDMLGAQERRLVEDTEMRHANAKQDVDDEFLEGLRELQSKNNKMVRHKTLFEDPKAMELGEESDGEAELKEIKSYFLKGTLKDKMNKMFKKMNFHLAKEVRVVIECDNSKNSKRESSGDSYSGFLPLGYLIKSKDDEGKIVIPLEGKDAMTIRTTDTEAGNNSSMVSADQEPPQLYEPEPAERRTELKLRKKTENMRKGKHYRRRLQIPLEKSDFMGEEIFFTLDIKRGKKVNLEKKSLLQRVFGTEEEKIRDVGKFRGYVEVMDDELLKKVSSLSFGKEILQDFELPTDLESFQHNRMDREMLRSVDVVIRVYMIEATFTKSYDISSENDTYLELELNGKKLKSDGTVMDKNRPKFYSMFTFEHTLPGPSDIHIRFYDYDPFKHDEFIGETVVDIERRFFDRRWRSFKEHPIEVRDVLHPNSSIPVGQTRLFVEIFDKSEPVPIPRNIKPRPAEDVEIRVIIWEVWDVSAQDFEDVSDIFVKVALPEYELSMNTDTHFRAQGGFGSFNWRTKFALTIDEYFKPQMADLQLLVYDRDLCSPNDFVSSATFNLAQIIEDTLYNGRRQKIFDLDENGSESSKFVCETRLKQPANPKHKPPKIRVSIECLTKKESEVSPAGIGRGDPNQDPHLEAPKGRFKFTLNPFKLIEQCVGPQFRKKAKIIICLVFCLLILILIFPILFSEVIATAFTKLLGL